MNIILRVSIVSSRNVPDNNIIPGCLSPLRGTQTRIILKPPVDFREKPRSQPFHEQIHCFMFSSCKIIFQLKRFLFKRFVNLIKRIIIFCLFRLHFCRQMREKKRGKKERSSFSNYEIYIYIEFNVYNF